MSLIEITLPRDFYRNPILEPHGIVLSLKEHNDVMGVLDDKPNCHIL